MTSGTVSASAQEPTCIFDGCTQSVVPGSAFCGREDHCASNFMPGLQDGSASPAANSLLGYGDGTGRSAISSRELRAETSKSGLAQISGRAILYSTPTIIHDAYGDYRETFQPGALTNALRRCDCRFLINHDGIPLARTTTGTLRLREDNKGVTFTADLDTSGSPLAADAVSAITRGDLSQCSFGFIVAKDVWNQGMTDRLVTDVAELLDVSAVTYPAYAQTSVQIGSDAQERNRQQILAKRDRLARVARRHQLARKRPTNR